MAESSDRLTCRTVHEGLTEYLEQALPSSSRQGFDEHFERCGACRRMLHDTRITLRRLASAPQQAMPAAMKESLLKALRSPSSD